MRRGGDQAADREASSCNAVQLPRFLVIFFDIQALWRSRLSTRMPECQKIKSGLDQYGNECFGRLIFVTVRKSVGLKGLKEAVYLVFIVALYRALYTVALYRALYTVCGAM